ncbi:MAG: SH3 domain-containing protein [Sarcina sp.]
MEQSIDKLKNTTKMQYGSILNTSLLHLREQPNIDSNTIALLTHNDIIKVTDKLENWYKVVVNKKVGFVYSYYLGLSDNVNAPQNETSPNLKLAKLKDLDTIHLRSEANLQSHIICTITKDEPFTILQKIGTWCKVKYNNHIGYIYNFYIQIVGTSEDTDITEISKDTQSIILGKASIVNATFLHLRKEPSVNADIIETLYLDDEILVLEKEDDSWYKIQAKDLQGYVYGYYLSITYKTIKMKKTSQKINANVVLGEIINSSYLHIRAGAGTNFSVLEDVYLGDKVEIIKKLGNWYEVKANGKIGYVFDYYIKIISGDISSNQESESATKLRKGKVINATMLNIRELPSTNSKILGTLNAGDMTTILSIKNGWVKTLFNDTLAYISSNYIEIFNENEDITKGKLVEFMATGKINSYLANIYSLSESDIIGQERLNTKLIIHGKKDDYYQISYRNAFGLIKQDRVTIIDDKIALKSNILPSVTASNSTIKNLEELKNTVITKYPVNVNQYIELQYNNWPLHSKKSFADAITPAKITNKFEFLKLNKFRSLAPDKLNKILNDTGVFKGKEKIFISAAQKYKIDPVFFVNQCLLETSYGKSKFSTGVTINEIAIQSKPIHNPIGELVGYEMKKLMKPATVYNIFAMDDSENTTAFPNKMFLLNTTYAYTQGWLSIEDSIFGAAEFISSNYLNNNYYKQDTLYKLKFSPQLSSIWHQYSNNILYPKQLSELMEKHQYLYIDKTQFSFDLPEFKSIH